MKSNTVAVLLILVMIVLVIIFSPSVPRVFEWIETYDPVSDEPYGTLIFSELTKDTGLEHIFSSPELQYTEWSERATLIIERRIKVKPNDENAIREIIRVDGDVWLFARDFRSDLIDSLGFRFDVIRNPPRLYRYEFKNRVFNHKNEDDDYNFAYIDSVPSGARVDMTLNGKPVLVSMQMGNGRLNVSTVPFIFANHYLLKDQNAELAESVFAAMPDAMLWSHYFNPFVGDFSMGGPQDRDFLNDHPPIYYALLLTLLAVLLFILVNLKRRHRIVPPFKPLRNQTLDFVETVGQLHFRYRDHREIARRRLRYFREFVRKHYHTDIHTNPEAAAVLAARSGVRESTVKAILRYHNQIDTITRLQADDLATLSHHIDRFYHTRN